MGVAEHNALTRVSHRVDQLEPRLARIVQPILDEAARDAARQFRRYAVGTLLSAAEQRRRARQDLVLVAGGALGRFALTAASDGVTAQSTMLALRPRPDQAARLAALTGADPEKLHVTLAYLGETDGDLLPVVQALHRVAGQHGPMAGKVAGIGQFEDGGNGAPVIMLPSVPGLVEARVAATEALHKAGIDYSRTHGYQPHITVGYSDDPTPDLAVYQAVGEPLNFDALHVVRGDREEHVIPLTGGKPLTASFTADGYAVTPCDWPGCSDPATWTDGDYAFCEYGHTAALTAAAGWTPPAPGHLIDVEALTAKLKAKTEPVRNALVETAMTPALKEAGLSFDVTNPFTAKVLRQSGSQISNISATTQRNVMATIDRSYKDGLSIPDTATAIQAGMTEANGARATLIARTELAGAANGGSLAATQIVTAATGIQFTKKWLTAPGAVYPRHELYDGLDGQETTLDGYFEVGDAQLQFPGDPDGPPEEVCNCLVDVR